jgi:hypothetical protein
MNTKTKAAVVLGFMLACVAGIAHAENKARMPEVPAALEVPDGYKVSFRALAEGVQIYTATVSPTNPSVLVWTFTGPQAVLFDFDGGIVGSHYAYAGPTMPGWESSSGSLVVAQRTVPPVTVDPNAIPWLRLDAIAAGGPGVFKNTAFIQRVNTTGGLAPATPPTQVGQEARVPYTAEYVFYRAEHGRSNPGRAINEN